MDKYYRLAEKGFNAYGDRAGWKSHNGQPMPAWDAVGEEIQSRWEAAAREIYVQARAELEAEAVR